MTSLLRTFSRALTSAGLAALGWSVVAQAQTPTVFNACVTPLTGLLYQPKEAGKCFLPSHHAIKWTDGLGAILAGSTANGDLDGTYPNPKVDGLRGRLVADVAPTTNQILAWNGTAWAPKDPSGGGAVGTAGGALTGTYPNPGLANGAVTTAALADGSVTEPKLAFNPATQAELDAAITTAAAAAATLQTNINAASEALNAYRALLANSGGTANAAGNPVSWNQLTDVPSGVISGGGASGVAGGDLSGTYPAPTVAKLQKTVVSAVAPATGQVLAFDGSAWKPTTPTAGGSGITGWEIVGNSDVLEPNTLRGVTVSCSFGNKPLGGGFALAPNLKVVGSLPTAQGWLVRFANTTGDFAAARLHRSCNAGTPLGSYSKALARVSLKPFCTATYRASGRARMAAATLSRSSSSATANSE